MGKNVFANKPCPCGSGKKYKYCCRDKEDDASFNNPQNLLKSYKEIRKESKIKQCLFPDHSNCSERVIGAHSIQNNKILKRISDNGDIYMPCPKSDNPFAVVTKWGRREATVFTGFCGYHDNEIFKPIENSSFDKSPFHVFLYTYRCFAVEYHKKQEVSNMQKSIFSRKPSLITMPENENPFKGMDLAIDDFQNEKEKFDNALLVERYDILSYLIWEFPKAINFAATGFEAPSRDLVGNKIQNLLDLSTTVQHVFMMIFPEDEKTFCIISWLKDNDTLFENMRIQLNDLNVEERKTYINNTLPIITENIAINPTSWNNWEQHEKDEFGMLLWGMSDISELSGDFYNRLSTPSFDMFDL